MAGTTHTSGKYKVVMATTGRRTFILEKVGSISYEDGCVNFWLDDVVIFHVQTHSLLYFEKID